MREVYDESPVSSRGIVRFHFDDLEAHNHRFDSKHNSTERRYHKSGPKRRDGKQYPYQPPNDKRPPNSPRPKARRENSTTSSGHHSNAASTPSTIASTRSAASNQKCRRIPIEPPGLDGCSEESYRSSTKRHAQQAFQPRTIIKPSDISPPKAARKKPMPNSDGEPWDSPMWYMGFGLARLRNAPRSPFLFQFYLLCSLCFVICVHSCILYSIATEPSLVDSSTYFDWNAFALYLCTLQAWSLILCTFFLLAALYAQFRVNAYKKLTHRPCMLRFVSLLLYLSLALVWSGIPVGFTFFQAELNLHIQKSVQELRSDEMREVIHGIGELGSDILLACVMFPSLVFTAIPIHACDILVFSNLMVVYLLTQIMYSLNMQREVYPSMDWSNPDTIAETCKKAGYIVCTAHAVFVVMGIIRLITGSLVYRTRMPMGISGNYSGRFYSVVVE